MSESKEHREKRYKAEFKVQEIYKLKMLNFYPQEGDHDIEHKLLNQVRAHIFHDYLNKIYTKEEVMLMFKFTDFLDEKRQ